MWIDAASDSAPDSPSVRRKSLAKTRTTGSTSPRWCSSAIKDEKNTTAGKTWPASTKPMDGSPAAVESPGPRASGPSRNSAPRWLLSRAARTRSLAATRTPRLAGSRKTAAAIRNTSRTAPPVVRHGNRSPTAADAPRERAEREEASQRQQIESAQEIATERMRQTSSRAAAELTRIRVSRISRARATKHPDARSGSAKSGRSREAWSPRLLASRAGACPFRRPSGNPSTRAPCRPS